MPRPPPRPLCLPELVSNPQTRADFVQANPPKYGPSSRPSSYDDATYPPPSPTSITDVESHRASGATIASLTSPVTPASTRTSLSAHSLPGNGDVPKRTSGIGVGLLSLTGSGSEGKGWGLSNLSLGGGDAGGKKPRASWSSAFVNTKSWFGNSARSEDGVAQKHSSQSEIKLSPSMITASTLSPSLHPRPVSSPYPAGNVDMNRSPKVGTGLQYYTEHNPAPLQNRTQIPDPIDLQDHDRPYSHPGPNTPTPTLMTFIPSVKELPTVPDATPSSISPLHLMGLKDPEVLRGNDTVRRPLSPPLTPPVHEREGNVPHIRVSSGEDL